MMNPTNQQHLEQQPLVDDINGILERHGVTEGVTRQDLTITDTSVSDVGKPTPKLSNAITDKLWPSITSAKVYHYTSSDAAEKILNSGVFRLTNIEKRLNDGEVVTFCNAHKLDGYLEVQQKSGLPYYRELMGQLFYASFTETNLEPHEEDYFWRNFGPIDGVRLTFEIEANNPNFRKIVYAPEPDDPIPLLDDLLSLREKHGRAFTLQGISRLCAFFLDGSKYSREKEYRALFKAWPEYPELPLPLPVGTGPKSYVEFPLGKTVAGYTFRVTEVLANTRPNIPDNYTFIQRQG